MKKGTSFKCFDRRTALLKFSLWTRSIIYAGGIGVYRRRRRNVQRKFLSMIVITAGGEYIFYTLFKTDNVSGRALIVARAKCRRAYTYIYINYTKAYLYGAYKGGSRRIYSSRLRLKMTSWSVASSGLFVALFATAGRLAAAHQWKNDKYFIPRKRMRVILTC